MDTDVVIVGSANTDLVVQVSRPPGRGETVAGSDLAVHPGGKGANQAVAAARLGAAVAFVGAVGDDENGRFLARSLRADGVDTTHLRTVSAPTGVALITVDADGDNAIVLSPGANARVGQAEVHAAREVISSAAVVALQLEIPMPAVVAAARLARRTILTLSPAREVEPELLARCDPLVVNEHEASFLLGNTALLGEAVPEAPERRAAALLGLGPASVVLTRGAAGAVVAEPTGVTSVPSPEVRAVDTTGAGDAFTGALAQHLADGAELVVAAHHAARVGAAAVGRAGAQSSFPHPGEY